LSFRTRRCEDGWCRRKLRRRVFSCRRSREWRFVRCCAHDVRLDNNIGWTADHQKVFNVIATDKDQAPPSVHRSGIDHCQAVRSREPLGAKATHQRLEESHLRSPHCFCSFTEQELHCPVLCAPSRQDARVSVKLPPLITCEAARSIDTQA
jgi:hypothetical protein